MINLIIFIISIIFVGAYAAFEISYVSLDKIKIQDAIPLSRLDFFVKREREVIISILIGINIFSVLAATTLTNYTRKLGFSSNYAVLASGLVTTLIIVFLGEIFPKSYAISRKTKIIKSLNTLIYTTYFSFFPIVKLFDSILRMSFARVGREKLSLEEEIEKYADDKGLESEKLLLLKKALKFYDLSAEDIMISTKNFPFWSIDTPREKILENVKNLSYNKILLYQNTIDNIVGLIHIKDLILAEESDIKRYLRPYSTVYSDSPLHKVVEEIKSKQTTVSIVINEYGATVGVITIETILRELLKYFEENGEYGNILPGEIRISELRERGLEFEEGDYSTLAGLIIKEAGERIPRVGERFKIGNYEVEIIDADDKGIKKVLIREKHEADNSRI